MLDYRHEVLGVRLLALLPHLPLTHLSRVSLVGLYFRIFCIYVLALKGLVYLCYLHLEFCISSHHDRRTASSSPLSKLIKLYGRRVLRHCQALQRRRISDFSRFNALVVDVVYFCKKCSTTTFGGRSIADIGHYRHYREKCIFPSRCTF